MAKLGTHEDVSVHFHMAHSMGRLPNAEGAAAVAQLVAAVMRRTQLGDTTRQAAEAALDAARAVEQALAAVAKREGDVRSALRMRDAVGVTWDRAVRAFRSRVIAAEVGDGVPNLYATLFAPVRRRRRKRNVPTDAPTSRTAT